MKFLIKRSEKEDKLTSCHIGYKQQLKNDIERMKLNLFFNDSIFESFCDILNKEDIFFEMVLPSEFGLTNPKNKFSYCKMIIKFDNNNPDILENSNLYDEMIQVLSELQEEKRLEFDIEDSKNEIWIYFTFEKKRQFTQILHTEELEKVCQFMDESIKVNKDLLIDIIDPFQTQYGSGFSDWKTYFNMSFPDIKIISKKGYHTLSNQEQNKIDEYILYDLKNLIFYREVQSLNDIQEDIKEDIKPMIKLSEIIQLEKNQKVTKQEIKQVFNNMVFEGYNYILQANHYKRLFNIKYGDVFVNVYNPNDKNLSFDDFIKDEYYFIIPDITFIKTDTKLSKKIFLEDFRFSLSDYKKLDESEKLQLFEYMVEKGLYMIKEGEKMAFYSTGQYNKKSSFHFCIGNIIECFDSVKIF